MKLGTAEVSFTHLRDEKVTLCTFAVKNKIFQGVAKCSNGDSYCRDEGRKTAMTYAMNKTKDVLTKRQRKNVWDAYRDMTKIPRW